MKKDESSGRQPEKMSAHDAIAESEARYRTLAESAQDAIYVVDRSERTTYVNNFAANLFKMPPAAIIGKQLKDIFPEDSYKEIIRKFEIVYRTKKPHLEEEELVFPGGERWFDSSLIPILDDNGEVWEIMGVSREITARRNRDAQMRLQAEALEASSNGILISDKNGGIEWVNQAFTEMTGYTLEEIKGQTPRVLKSGEQPAEFYKELWDVITSGRPWRGELINRRKDGRLYFEAQTITPVKNSLGEIIHFIAIKQDISAAKLLETQFKQAQKMDAVGRLAGGVAHDFNNLLTVIIGQSDIVLGSPILDSAVSASIDEIRKAGIRAAALTRQLLAFSRKQVFQVKITDLNEIVRAADKLLRRLIGEDIELVTLLGANMRPVKVDFSQMEQVIMNFAVNARDAMPGGGKLIIETSDVTVDAEFARLHLGTEPGDYSLMKVSDTGCGMTPEVQAKLFEPFFTTKGPGKGTGLGLSTVYGIVKQSAGSIHVESRVDQGTTFSVYLPVSGESKEAVADTKAAELPRGTAKILVAEDEEMVRSLAAHILSRQGYETLEAGTGSEALAIAAAQTERPIELLFTDMIMPHMGGNELAEKFSKKNPTAKIIFTSGYSDHSVVQHWIDKGYRFLQKPYTYAELLMVVQETLDSKNSER